MNSNYRKWLVAAAAVLLVSVISHMSALRNAYVLDDFKLIVGNEFITRWENAAILVSPKYIFKPFSLTCGARPLTVFSLMVDYRLWGLNPFGFHLTNILLHAANGVALFFAALLVFRSLRPAGRPPGGTGRQGKTPGRAGRQAGTAGRLKRYFFFAAAALQRTFRAGSIPGNAAFAAALVAALVFTLHPIQAEAVNIASFRADLLAAFFSLLSLLCFAAASAAPHPRSLVLYAGAAGFFALALFSKETAVAVPLVFLVYRMLQRKPVISRRNIAVLIVFGAIAALFITLFWSSRYEYRGFSAIFPSIQDNVSPFSSAAAYVNVLLRSFLHYAGALLAPFSLSVDYSIPSGGSVFSPANFLSLLLLTACAAVFVRSRDRWLRFGLGFAFLTYLPVSNLIPLINTVNDRYLYLPMAGFSMVAAAAVRRLPEWQSRVSLRLAAALVLLFLYGAATLYRNPVFRDGYTLYHDAMVVAPDNVRSRYNFAIALMVNGRFEEALREFEAVEQLNPLYKRSNIWFLKGECYVNTDNFAEAKESYRKALFVRQDKEALRRYASLLAVEGNPGGAVSFLEKGAELFPGDVDLYNDMGAYYGLSRDYTRAISCFKQAVALDPENNAAWLNMLGAYGQGKRPVPAGEADKLLDYLTRNGWEIEDDSLAGQAPAPAKGGERGKGPQR